MTHVLPGDTDELRKERGAFFTPYPIAEFLVSWALAGRSHESLSVLDPTCGEGAFLLAAATHLRGRPTSRPASIFGVDIHQQSLKQAAALIPPGDLGLDLLRGDFFDEPSPDQLGSRIPAVDAVVGNPPFVRYHEHRGEVRRKATAAALRQGVRLSGLASSWAALLVHASSFLKPDGRIAMVLPAELLSVGYAEPIRRWLRRRFQAVHLVLFHRLQFSDAEEQVVLLVARGSGGCNAFTLHEVESADDLARLHIFDAEAFAPREEGKWTDLLLPEDVRAVLRRVGDDFSILGDFGTVELGTVTGANQFFMLSDATRVEYGLQPGTHVIRSVPPGSRHIPGVRFTLGQWETLRLAGERVWMLSPTARQPIGKGFCRYVALGESLGVHEGYKCSIREPWWRAPAQPPPDMFFTYMSHVTPRLIENAASTTFVNSMHGVRLSSEALEADIATALPIVALNSVTMLSAEIAGRSYGGGILKMEPREAAQLIVPPLTQTTDAWKKLSAKQHALDELIKAKRWTEVSDQVDEVLLIDIAGLRRPELHRMRHALVRQRARRQRQGSNANADG